MHDPLAGVVLPEPELGLKGALHAFRHGNATALDRMNVPMKVRQERLGHVEPQTTMGLHASGE